MENDSQYSELYQITPMEQISAPKSTQRALDKLLDKMYISNVSKRLRELNQPSDIDKKRWIWELLQNAKDTIVSNPNRHTIKARIIIEGDIVKFQHDGDPFSADARLALLYKYGDDKENAESTGRFGTGFLTTHCLSKIVSIESNMMGDENALIGFVVTMYRDGTTEGDLLDGLKKMRNSEKYYNQSYEWTTFTYHINSESGRRAVKLGKEHFKENIAQTFLFCKELESVELIDNGEKTYIERISDNQLTSKIHQAQFKIILDKADPITRTFIYCYSEEADEELSAKYKAERHIRLQVACEVDENKNIVSTGEKTSLFCVFPLVGIEGQIQMPIFVNSPDFEPDSERQNLIMNGVAKDEEKGIITEVGINQKILCKLPGMFKLLVEYLSENSYDGFYNLLNGLKSVKDHEKLDKEWYKDNIISELRKVITDYPISKPYRVTDTCRYRKLSDCVIVKEEKKESEDVLFDLLTSLYPDKLISDNSKWAHMLWKDGDIRLWNVEDVCKDIESKGSLDSLSLSLEVDVLTWYNKFLAFVQNQNKLLFENYALLPNMNRTFMKRKAEHFKQGEGVTSIVLDVLKELGRDMRPLLLHESITAVSLDSKFNSNSYSAEVNRLAKGIITDWTINNLARLQKLRPLISVVVSECSKYEMDFISMRSRIFEITKELFELHDWQTTTDNSLNKAAWDETDKWVVNFIISTIESKGTLGKLPEGLGAKWLNDVIKSLRISLKTMDDKAIVPNQYGTFCLSRNLYIDDGVPEVLKNEVFKEIDIDYRGILLDKAIDLRSLGKTSSKDISSFADELLDRTKLVNQTYSTYRSYGGYRKYCEETLSHVAHYMIQIVPTTDNDGIQQTQIELRDTARFFLKDESLGVDGTIEYADSKLWSRVNEFICRDIATSIEEYGGVKAIVEDLFTSENLLFEYLNILYHYTEKHNLSLDNKAIYPNQAGKFVYKEKLYKESGNIDKVLKDVIALISADVESYYNILIDSRCVVSIEKTKSSADAYAHIDGKIKELYDIPAKWEDKSFKEAARLLIDEWGESNKNLFDENHFPKVYPIKDSICMNVVWTKEERQKVQTLNNILKTENIDIEDLKGIRTRYAELEDKNARLQQRLQQLIEDIKSGKIKPGEIVEFSSDEDNDASKKQMYEAQLEAQRKLMEIKPSWKFPYRYGECNEEGKPYNFSTIEVIDENGESLYIVLKSYKSHSGKFKINPTEWLWVVERHAKLYVYTNVKGELDIVEVPQTDLVMNQSKISITFSTENLDNEKYADRISTFADTLHYFKELHFNFERFNISGNAKRVKDIYAKREGAQTQTTDEDL